MIGIWETIVILGILLGFGLVIVAGATAAILFLRANWKAKHQPSPAPPAPPATMP